MWIGKDFFRLCLVVGKSSEQKLDGRCIKLYDAGLLGSGSVVAMWKGGIPQMVN